MRVLFMVTRDPLNPGVSGGDMAPWEYARYLAAAGHSATFLCSGFLGAKHEEVIDGVHVVRLGSIPTLWVRTFLYYMRYCRGRFDVVVEEGFGGSRIPRFAPLYVKEPIVTAWHQVHGELFANQFPRVLVPWLNLLERCTVYVHRNTLVQAYTEQGQRAFAAIGFRRENVFVVPVSIREEWLDQSATTATAEPLIVCLGKFRRYKCPDHVVLAFQEVTKAVPDAQLVLAGRHDDRAYEDRLARLITRLGLEQSVTMQFDLDEAEKKSLLRRARALVVPSSVEGFGIVILEANACGTPVIASSGVPEGAVCDGQNGLRYHFGDVSALAARIVEILKDERLYNQLSTDSAAFARKFAWSRVGAQYEDILTRAATRQRSLAPG